jgi:hypothetical protein
MDWMAECIKHVSEFEPIAKDGDKNFKVACRVSFAKGFLSQCEGFEQVVALLDAINAPLRQEA